MRLRSTAEPNDRPMVNPKRTVGEGARSARSDASMTTRARNGPERRFSPERRRSWNWLRCVSRSITRSDGGDPFGGGTAERRGRRECWREAGNRASWNAYVDLAGTSSSRGHLLIWLDGFFRTPTCRKSGATGVCNRSRLDLPSSDYALSADHRSVSAAASLPRQDPGAPSARSEASIVRAAFLPVHTMFSRIRVAVIRSGQ